MRNKWRFMPLLGLGFLALLVLGGEVVRLLWNWIVPPIVGWRDITFWQALGLLALCRILFGGRGSSFPGRRRHCGPDRERLRSRMRERFGPAAREDEPPAGPAII